MEVLVYTIQATANMQIHYVRRGTLRFVADEDKENYYVRVRTYTLLMYMYMYSVRTSIQYVLAEK
jgi:hypothetical protein